MKWIAKRRAAYRGIVSERLTSHVRSAVLEMAVAFLLRAKAPTGYRDSLP